MFLMTRLGAAAALLIGVAVPSAHTAVMAGREVITTDVMVERPVRATNGATRTELIPVEDIHIGAGDQLVFLVHVSNAERAPVKSVIVTTPVPDMCVYAGLGRGSLKPSFSVDGVNFGPLSALTVKGANGQVRAATTADVRLLRWLLPRLAGKASATVSFRATVK